eukprot:UN24572
MIQKQIFGGIQMSQGFLDWATIPGTLLDTLLYSKSDIVERRQTKHHFVCGHDALFHVNKGVVGIRVEFMGNVLLDNVEVMNIANDGDMTHWFCDREFQLYDNMERIKVERFTDPYRGSDVLGIALSKSEGVILHDVVIDQLISEEGMAVGIQTIVDTSDRTDYTSADIDYSTVHVGHLKAGRGGKAKAFLSDQIGSELGKDVIFENGPDMHNEFDNGKLNWAMENNQHIACNSNAENAQACLDHFEYTEEEMVKLTKDIYKFFRITYGIDIEYSDPWWQVPEDPEGNWVMVRNNQQGQMYMVCDKGDCRQPQGRNEVRETYLALVVLKQFTVHGTYGGVQGKDVYNTYGEYGDYIVAGAYKVWGVKKKKSL